MLEDVSVQVTIQDWWQFQIFIKVKSYWELNSVLAVSRNESLLVCLRTPLERGLGREVDGLIDHSELCSMFNL